MCLDARGCWTIFSTPRQDFTRCKAVSWEVIQWDPEVCGGFFFRLYHQIGPSFKKNLTKHASKIIVAGTLAQQICGGGGSKAPAAKKIAAKGKKSAASASASSDDTAAAVSSDYSPDFIPGLILLSYPLHTADNTKALRDQILYDIPARTSTLFISGLKDSMCQPKIFEKVFKDMTSSPREAIQIQDADHGLGYGSSKPAKAKKESLTTSIQEWVVAFMDDTIAGLEDRKDGAKAVVSHKKATLKQTGDEWTFVVSSVV